MSFRVIRRLWPLLLCLGVLLPLKHAEAFISQTQQHESSCIEAVRVASSANLPPSESQQQFDSDSDAMPPDDLIGGEVRYGFLVK